MSSPFYSRIVSLSLIWIAPLAACIGAQGATPAQPSEPAMSPPAQSVGTAPQAETSSPAETAPPADQAAAAPPAVTEPPIECNKPDLQSPAQLSAAHYATRRGADTRELPELATTRNTPVEVCGRDGQRAFLLAVQCADGSRPLTDERAIRRARRGNVGLGGRCNSVIDLFEVECPGGRHRVHVDLYFCPAAPVPAESP